MDSAGRFRSACVLWPVDNAWIRLRRGFVHLVAVMDWYSRCVLSCAVSTTLDAWFVWWRFSGPKAVAETVSESSGKQRDGACLRVSSARGNGLDRQHGEDSRAALSANP